LQPEFIDEIVRRLENAGVVYAITGSVASSLWGIPRLTHDVDLVLVLSSGQVGQVVSAFADSYYVSEQAAHQAVRSGGMFNVIDPSKNLKADLWVFAGDPFNQAMLDRRRRVTLASGREAFVGSPEDVLLHKLVWNRITPSERQLADAAGIAAVQQGSLDLNYLRSWAARQDTTDLLEEVLQGKHLKQT
jgi:hypothetical protein